MKPVSWQIVAILLKVTMITDQVITVTFQPNMFD